MRRRVLRAALRWCAGVGLFAACGAGAPPAPAGIGPDPDYAELTDRLSEIARAARERHRIPGLALALTSGDRIVWAQGFGEARPGVPADADTLFRVGSVSKLFTDIAVLARRRAGELDIDAPVAEVLPGFAPAAGPAAAISLRQLMAHRAGLVREPPVGHYFDDSAPTLEATVSSLSRAPLVFPPGTREKYSNAGIAVVGRVLERISGKPFAEAVTESVLDPLGLDSSFFSLARAPADRLARGSMWSYDGREFPAPTFPLGMAPAGSMVSSVRDLGRFLTLLAGGELPGVLDGESLSEMWRVQFPENPDDPDPAGFGLGFHLGALETGDGGSLRLVGHGGAIYGFSTELAFLPEAGFGAVAVSNVDFTNGVVRRIVRSALRGLLARGRELPRWRPSDPLPPDLGDLLHGLYENEGGSRARVTARGAGAQLEIGSRTVALRAANGAGSEGNSLVGDFRLLGPRLSVVSGPAGGVHALEIDSEVFRRISDPLPPPPPPEFLPLLGEYGWDHNILFVFERDGALTVLIEWLERYAMIQDAADPDRFHFPDHGLYPGESLRFLRGPNGRVTGADLSGIVFPRRPDPGEGTFRIEPLLPIGELRRLAGEASPPVEEGDFLAPDLVRLTDLDPSIRLDVRYASEDNFMGTAFYEVADAFLQRPAAEALVRANAALREYGYGIVVHDGYRPWRVTRMFFDATPEPQRIFVADPASGSRHNRGAAVDIGLYDLETGGVLQFVSGYDEFSERAFPRYVGGTSPQRWLRELLRRAMEREGFAGYEYEWWHFDFGGWERYRIQNLPLHRVGGAGS